MTTARRPPSRCSSALGGFTPAAAAGLLAPLPSSPGRWAAPSRHPQALACLCTPLPPATLPLEGSCRCRRDLGARASGCGALPARPSVCPHGWPRLLRCSPTSRSDRAGLDPDLPAPALASAPPDAQTGTKLAFLWPGSGHGQPGCSRAGTGAGVEQGPGAEPGLGTEPCGRLHPSLAKPTCEGLGGFFTAAAAPGRALHPPGAEGSLPGLDPAPRRSRDTGQRRAARSRQRAALLALGCGSAAGLCGAKGARGSTQPSAHRLPARRVPVSPAICSGDPGPPRDLTELRGGRGRPGGAPAPPRLWGSPAADVSLSTQEFPVVLPEGRILGSRSHVGACRSPPGWAHCGCAGISRR